MRVSWTTTQDPCDPLEYLGMLPAGTTLLEDGFCLEAHWTAHVWAEGDALEVDTPTLASLSLLTKGQVVVEVPLPHHMVAPGDWAALDDYLAWHSHDDARRAFGTRLEREDDPADAKVA